jgi:uncharacterized protein
MDPTSAAPANRLAQEPSPYLRQHAHNPVDWFPWGKEALERARALDRPILLSVGYSACHWCHVMAHESFEDPQTAELMNGLYVNVKVDREERPDLDQLYQGVVQLMGRGGGWPLTVFLTPDLRPFYGGTYFPKEERFGLPSFRRLLAALAEAWQERRAEVQGQARQFEEGLGFIARHGLEAPQGTLGAQELVRAARAVERDVDRDHGGFGGAPKFPNPMSLALLLRGYRRTGEVALLSAVTLSLEKMANGGIYDQLGGGFHRYSVDGRWLVPHFEKMLYDNAQLLHLYTEAQQLAPSTLWRKVVEETVEYLGRELLAPGGGLYAAQDADSEGEEGKFFVWTQAELDAALPPELAKVVRLRFDFPPGGNFEHGGTVLEVVCDEEEIAAQLGLGVEPVRKALAEARRRLFEHRAGRIPPGTDDKVLAGWNGLAIRGLAFAGRVFDRADWIALARQVADAVVAQQWKQGTLYRSFQRGQPRIEGFIEDYGHLAAGLVALYQASFEPAYLEVALALEARAHALFWDEEALAYLTASKGQPDLLCATYALHDNAVPSGASTLTEAQVGLAALTGKMALLERAERYLRRMAEPMGRHPMAYGHLWLAADGWLDGAALVTVVGSQAQAAGLLQVTAERFAPTVVRCWLDPAQPIPEVLAQAAQARVAEGGRAQAYVCRHFSCLPPVAEPAALEALLMEGAEGAARGL